MGASNSTSLSGTETLSTSVRLAFFSSSSVARATISFSYKLAGLKDGKNTVMVYVKGDVRGTVVGMESQMISFKVYSFPTTLVAVTSVVSVAVIGTALLFFLKKRKH
jgi:hypothetical protein